MPDEGTRTANLVAIDGEFFRAQFRRAFQVYFAPFIGAYRAIADATAPNQKRRADTEGDLQTLIEAAHTALQNAVSLDVDDVQAGTGVAASAGGKSEALFEIKRSNTAIEELEASAEAEIAQALNVVAKLQRAHDEVNLALGLSAFRGWSPNDDLHLVPGYDAVRLPDKVELSAAYEIQVEENSDYVTVQFGDRMVVIAKSTIVPSAARETGTLKGLVARKATVPKISSDREG
jgi:hypothetical protein